MDGEDIFKPPSLPPPPTSVSSNILFKMPPVRKFSDSIPASAIIGESTIEPASASKVSLNVAEKEEEKEKGDEKETKKLLEAPKLVTVESTYKPPAWAGPCKRGTYDLDILKDGRIAGNIALSTKGDDGAKSFYVFGRQGDVIVEHPSISRHHTVIQYRSIGDPHQLGWYLFDMGSTHGTFLNKEKIPPFMHVPIRVGHMFKLGFSTRMYILNGPDEDMEPESGMSVTEIQQQVLKQKLLMSKRREAVPAAAKGDVDAEKEESSMEISTTETTGKEEPDTGISWGMSDDYGEDEEKEKDNDKDVEVDAGESAMETIEDIQKREQLYIDDPKKALKNFYDRQGYTDEMNFEFTERGTGARHQWTCRLELPIESETGRPVYAEASVSAGKKEATVACALEACRILDAAGLLRKSSQDSKKRKSKEWADNDFYDSDEDTFLDRTGDVERKRAKRMRQAAELESGQARMGAPETYDTLSLKLKDVNAEIERVQRQIDLIKAEASQDDSNQQPDTPSARDSLDAYMSTMSRRDAQESKVRQSRLRLKLTELKKSADRLEKLVKLTKPTSLPPIAVKKSLETDSKSKKQTIMIGTMKGHRMRKLVTVPETTKDDPKADTGQEGLKEEDVVETEEDEEKMEKPKKEIQADKESVSAEKKQEEKATKPTRPDVSKITLPEEPIPIEKIEDDEEASKSIKSSNPRQRQKKQKQKPTSETETFAEYDPSDGNYAVWLPPENQSGDGRTSLNDKFGY